MSDALPINEHPPDIPGHAREADATGAGTEDAVDSNDQKEAFFAHAPGASDADEITAAAERQRDPAALAAWYAGRARELDARAGQLRHAAALCRLGARRVVSSSGGVDVTGGQLLQLDRLLQHLSSLVRVFFLHFFIYCFRPNHIFYVQWLGVAQRVSRVCVCSLPCMT